MSHSLRGSPKSPTAAPPPPRPSVETPALDLRTASASQLITEVVYLESLLLAVDVHDPTIVNLLEREQGIREELSRREVHLMHGLRGTTLANTSASRPAGHVRLNAAKARNGAGRDVSSGPGRWKAADR